MIIKPLIDITSSLILLEFSEETDDEDEDEDDDVVSMMIGFFAPSFPPPLGEVETRWRVRRQSAGEDCKLIINNTVMISMEFLNIDDLLFSIFWEGMMW